jgi:glycosyltransferase involved in cell wall biosynthesis
VTVTVSMPAYRTAGTIRHAVESVLAQTYDDLVLVVVADGDPSCWVPLATIDDPRLVRFDLPANMGRYYCDAVTLSACATDWWSPHDADDWSAPDRLEKLLAAAEAGAVATFSTQTVHQRDGSVSVERPQFRRRDTHLCYVAHHAGIYRSDALRQVGGYHPDMRCAWDTVVPLLMTLVGDVVTVDESLYTRYVQPDGLTQAPSTKFGSKRRKADRRAAAKAWAKAQATPRDQIGARVLDDVSDRTAKAVAADAARLRGILEAL